MVLNAQSPTTIALSEIQHFQWIEGLSALRVGLLFATFFGAGLMRRGPLLFYQPPSMGVGNGTGPMADVKIDTTKPYKKSRSGKSSGRATPVNRQLVESGKEEEFEPEPNVVDYDNCSVLSFVFIGFVRVFHISLEGEGPVLIPQ